MQRIIFTLKMLWFYRKSLSLYLKDLSLQTKTIFQLSLPELKTSGIEAIVLDYDGVLAGYAVETPGTREAAWLKEALDIFGSHSIFILSNRPSSLRLQYFAQHFPDIHFVKASRKKPYPDGILAIVQQTKLPPERILMLDDRLLTGILASIIAGIRALWVSDPTINFYHRPLLECGFIFLRWLDTVLIRTVNISGR